jgi:4-hydroxy-tetrahydrodipicolinate synthase
MHNGLTPTMKAAMKILGVSASDPYPPYPPIGGEELKALAAYLKTTDLVHKH